MSKGLSKSTAGLQCLRTFLLCWRARAHALALCDALDELPDVQADDRQRDHLSAS